jgi:hypothetical protein
MVSLVYVVSSSSEKEIDKRNPRTRYTALESRPLGSVFVVGGVYLVSLIQPNKRDKLEQPAGSPTSHTCY